MPSSYQLRFEEVVSAAISGATVVTANTRAARSILSACERELRAKHKVWLTPQVLPLGSWLAQLWREAQARGIADKVLLSSSQQLEFWKQIVDRSGAMRELLRPESAAPEAVEAWRLLHSYRVSRNSSAFASTLQTRQFLGWCSAYETLCRERGFIDDVVLADRVLELVQAERSIAPARLVAWGFDEIIPQQAQFYAGLREAGVDCEVAIPDAEGSCAPVRVEATSAEDECIHAARWARAHIEANADARVAVVVPSLAGVRAQVRRVFLRELNPEFLVGTSAQLAFDISLGLPLASYPLVRAATLALRLAVEPLPFAELRELLLSPYLGDAELESSQRAVLVRSMVDNAGEKLSLAQLVRVVETHGGASAPKLYAMVREFERKVKELPGRANRSQWSRAASELLAAMQWAQESDKLNSEEYQTLERWRELLAEVGALELACAPCTASVALRTIVDRAQSRVFAPQNRAAAVQVLGESEAAGSVFDALWVCGLTDEAWPPRRRANAFLPMSLQREHGLPGGSPELNAEAANCVLRRLCASSPDVVLSTPRAADDRELRPSSVIVGITSTPIDSLRLASSVHYEDKASECESIIDEIAPTARAEELTHSGTSVIEKQSLCPFRAFAESRLEAVTEEEPPVGIRATTRGNVIEFAMQRVWEALREQNQLLQTGAEELAQIVWRAVDEALAEKLPTDDDAVGARLREIERARLGKLICEWLTLESGRERFSVVDHQRDVRFELGGMPVKGRIDRVDNLDDGALVVLDYKAGTDYKFAQWKTPRPQRPQLPLYAVALAQQGRELAGLAFAKIKTGKCEFAGLSERSPILAKKRPPSKRVTDGHTLKEWIELWEKELARLAADHLAGHAEVDPKIPPGKNNASCQYCGLEPLCRVAELDLAAEDDADVVEGGEDE